MNNPRREPAPICAAAWPSIEEQARRTFTQHVTGRGGARCPGPRRPDPARRSASGQHGRLRSAGGWPEFSVTRRGVMTERSTYPEDDPRHHTAHLREMLQGLVSHAREDIGKISEPKAQALFETTAEVCTGLIKAFDDYDKKAPAWR